MQKRISTKEKHRSNGGKRGDAPKFGGKTILKGETIRRIYKKGMRSLK